MKVYSNNKQVGAYLDNRGLKQREIEMIRLIQERCGANKHGRWLDLGCADALFLDALRRSFSGWELIGLEINKDLLERAYATVENTNIRIVNEDASTYASDDHFDVVTASGLLSVFDEPLQVLDCWLKLLKPEGLLIVFGTFSPFDMDIKINYRNNYNSSEWETGINSFAQKTFERHLSSLNLVPEFIPFEMSVDLKKGDDPIRSYTIKDENGKRMVIAGNTIKNLYYMLIKKTVV